MRDCNHEYESIVAQAHLDMCLHCGQPEVNHTIATLRARNEELEAELAALRERTIAETVGWCFTLCCIALDNGEDIRALESPAVLEQAMAGLLPREVRDE